MRRLAQVSLSLLFCCAYGVQPQAAPAPEAKPAGAALSPKDPGYIEEDPILAKLVGKPAPALTLKSIDGKSINLSDLLWEAAGLSEALGDLLHPLPGSDAWPEEYLRVHQ